ncbi:prepilin-type N-terminal cleavage/methylation domain-containing protein [Chthoniobacter flavus]|nr:prepilin-type N-terminal cleavage/methylation domain-containing protein [Chthoniobacter flavus]TCO87344.1 prepilin-type N-terminal cleavage/methylation domain-containing protein [Chthoniobacter flavus]
MFCRSNPRARSAFTLLEMIIAMMIVSMIVFTIYRFVSTHLLIMQASTEIGDERESMEAVINLVQGQLGSLPALEPDALLGKAYKFHGLSNDEMTWMCGPGSGLLTTAAQGEYQVTLTVQPMDSKSSETELGLRRRPSAANKSSVELTRGSGTDRYDWQPLISPMAALEIRYYDSVTNSWVDQWTDGSRRPPLVRLRLQKHKDDAPIEAVLNVPSSQLTP